VAHKNNKKRIYDHAVSGRIAYVNINLMKYKLLSPTPLDTPQEKNSLIQNFNNILQENLLQRAAGHDYELSKLIAEEKHFYNLFKNVAVPIIESDCSRIKIFLMENKANYGENPKQYFMNHPEETNDLIKKLEILEINNAALRFFKINNKISVDNELMKIYASFVNHTAPTIFEGILENSKNIRYETEVNDFYGKKYTVIMRLSAESDDYSRTFIIFEDITATKKVQEELEYHVQERTAQLEATNKKLRCEIDSREKVELELRRSEARYQQLNIIYPVGIFHINKEGVTTYCNPKLLKIQGVSMEEVKNGEWGKYLHPEDRERVMNAWIDARTLNEAVYIDYRFKHDNKITWVNAQTVPEYDEAGNIAGHVGIVSDITRLHEAEEQLKQTQIDFAHFARVNSMGEVASGIAHELNQPLTAISNFMSGCKRRLLNITDFKVPQDILDAIENTAKQAHRAGTIIHNLKDFLRKGELSKQKFNLNGAIQDVIFLSKKSISDKKIILKLRLARNLPEINADKIHIEQVILNIFNNSIDAIDENQHSTKEIILRTKLYKNNFVRISIGDSGMGMTKELISTIFNPFMTTKVQGMGIGLSLSHNIIDKHQGTISVVSRPGKGTIFHITLPVE
jgi:two-component system sensor kinase FixL